MPAGTVLKATVTWQNTGTQAHAFDIAVGVGKGTSPADFKYSAYNIAFDVYSNPGDTRTTDVQVGPLGTDLTGTWDIIVLIGDWDPVNQVFSYTDWLVCYDVLVVG